MGKRETVIYEYDCDHCSYNSKEPKDFIIIRGELKTPNNFTYINTNKAEDGEVLLCKKCFSNLFKSNKDKNNIENKTITENSKDVVSKDLTTHRIKHYGVINTNSKLNSILKSHKLTEIAELINKLDVLQDSFKYDDIVTIISEFDEITYVRPEQAKEMKPYDSAPENTFTIYKRLTTDEDEETLAKKLGFKDQADMIQRTGESLISYKNIFYRLNYYVENIKGYNCKVDQIKICDKLSFGIPIFDENVISYLFHNNEYAFVPNFKDNNNEADNTDEDLSGELNDLF